MKRILAIDSMPSAALASMLTSIEAATDEVENVGEAIEEGEVTAAVVDPKNCFDDVKAATMLTSMVDWSKADPRTGSRGNEYLTTTAHNVTVEDDKYRYQWQISCNRRPKAAAAPQGLTSAETRKIAEAQKILTQAAARTGKSAEVLLSQVK